MWQDMNRGYHQSTANEIAPKRTSIPFYRASCSVGSCCKQMEARSTVTLRVRSHSRSRLHFITAITDFVSGRCIPVIHVLCSSHTIEYYYCSMVRVLTRASNLSGSVWGGSNVGRTKEGVFPLNTKKSHRVGTHLTRARERANTS